MYITYDSKVDAVYLKLISGSHQVSTHQVDDDINLNFDEFNRLVGIEVLDASERLDLANLEPFMKRSDIDRGKLKKEIERRLGVGEPVLTRVQHRKNWIEEVGEDYVWILREASGNRVRITWRDIGDFNVEQLKRRRRWAITRALRDIARGCNSGL